MNRKEILKPGQESIAVIRLKGEPYQKTVDGEYIDSSSTLDRLVQNTGYKESLPERIEQVAAYLQPLYEAGYYGIDARLKKGQPLIFEEAFSAMTFVSMGVNKAVFDQLSTKLPSGMPSDQESIFYQSIALLSALSAKEGYVGLTPEEIAGLVGATLHLDTIIRIPADQPVMGMGGMGGDRGYKRNGDNSKLFSLSTLGAIVLANFGPTHKHHSYPNTSKVAGQSAIESLGARSDQSTKEAFQTIQNETGLLMTSCHTTRLIHTLSHRLKGETINHIVGPLSIPVAAETPIHAFIGVNDNVHPETIIQALKILEQKGIQTYKNSVAFCGLNNTDINDPDLYNSHYYYQRPDLKANVAIDEVAPPPHFTLASFLVNGENQGTYTISPQDFIPTDLLDQIDFNSLLIANTVESITQANQAAVTGQDLPKTIYLAMTAALGIFTRNHLGHPDALDRSIHQVNREMLQASFVQAFETIVNGQALRKLEEYVKATKQNL